MTSLRDVSRVDFYEPIPGGWRKRISASANANHLRQHCRPLFPPADRSLLFRKDDLAKIDRIDFPCEVVGYHGPQQTPIAGPHWGAIAFRPVILAYNGPRFVFDLHTAGGLCGHLITGLAMAEGAGKWFHDWSEIEVSYVHGRMEYRLRDEGFPGMTVALTAIAQAGAVGLVVKYEIRGLTKPASLVWSYGGASAFFTNYHFDAPEFHFAPEQCAKDRLRWKDGAFTLRRPFDEKDVYLQQGDAVARFLPSWQVVMSAGASPTGTAGFGDPRALLASPHQLLAATEPGSGDREETNRVVVQQIPVKNRRATGFIVVGMGGNIRQAIREPRRAFHAALRRNRGIGATLVTRTPDPHLDAANTIQAYANEALWGDASFVHGGWAWRQPYLGWRIWYGPTCLGWTKRVRQAIRNTIRLGLARDPADPDYGALGSIFDLRCFGRDRAVQYNMNQVFLDHVRHYFEHTNDLELMREIFPVLKGIVAWHNRRLQPENEGLYESALDICVSDHHFYIRGQTTQASAYLLRAHRLLADVATRLGEDPAPFRERARLIHTAMQRRLWMPRPGVFAEYADTLNHRLLHPEPALPAIFHSAEFGAASPLQIRQMLHWVDTHLESVTVPGGGKLWWASNWSPTYSHFEPNNTDNLNFALTNYLGGRATEAYDLIRGVLAGIFEGPNPGCLSAGAPGLNVEFGDTVSMWPRMITEGLFGIVPKRPDGLVELGPQFPADWHAASIRTPHFEYEWRGKPGRISIAWQSPVKTAVRFRLPLHAAKIGAVRINGRRTRHAVEPGFGFTWLVVTTRPSRKGSLRVEYTPSRSIAPAEKTVKEGDVFEMNLVKNGAADYLDPQSILKDASLVGGGLRAVAGGEPGPGLFFLSSANQACPSWIPLKVRVAPKTARPPRRWMPPDAPSRDLSRWQLIDLKTHFNASLADVFDRVIAASQWPKPPASEVGFDYWQTHLFNFWPYTAAHDKPSDAAWRRKVGPDGVAWTTDGIPFQTVKEGPNLGVVTLMGGFPTKLEIPVSATGRTLYLMIGGMTFPTQSHVPNLRVHLHYADGQTHEVDLVPPFDLSDCWGKFFDDYGTDKPFHKIIRFRPRKPVQSCGFENIGGRVGPSGSAEIKDPEKWVTVDTEAKLVPIDLRPEQELASIGIEVIANTVIFGVMGASILKQAFADGMDRDKL